MTWGKLLYKDGSKLDVDDVQIVGAAVRVMTAHEHKERIIPLWNVSEVTQGEPNGKEWKLDSRMRPRSVREDRSREA